MDAVVCRGLTKNYGPKAVVDRLDLVVRKGDVFGFVGPNGAGKTTNMRMLLGLVHPSRGSMWVNGRELPDPTGLDRIGAMIEEPSFYPWLSGRQNLETLARCGRPLGGSGSIDRVLEMHGLAAAADRKVKTYSQGMRQRLGLAAAMMRAPDLLILDEPTNGMDPAGLQQFRVILRDFAEGGSTVLLSSHLLAEIEVVCDEVAVISNGRLIEQGKPSELTTARPHVRAVVQADDRAVALSVLGDWSPRVDFDGAIIIEIGDARAVSERLGRAAIWVEQLGVMRIGLEAAFMALTASDGASDEIEVTQ